RPSMCPWNRHESFIFGSHLWEGGMRQSRRGLLALGLAAAMFALPACSSSANDNNSGGTGGDKQVEVFSWWAGPGEKEGLDAMIADFKQKNPGVEFNNAAVAGGAGTNA